MNQEHKTCAELVELTIKLSHTTSNVCLVMLNNLVIYQLELPPQDTLPPLRNLNSRVKISSNDPRETKFTNKLRVSFFWYVLMKVFIKKSSKVRHLTKHFILK